MKLQNSGLKKAALVCRVSTKKQGNLRQLELLQEYSTRLGYTVHPDNVYEDKISGYSQDEKRPELVRFYSDVTNGEKFDAVFFDEVRAIARESHIGHKIIHQIKENYKIPIYVKAPMEMCSVVNGKENPSFGLMMGILLAMADSEVQTMKYRIKSGIKTKVRQGYHHGGVIPYGYKVVNKRLLIDEEEAEVVKRMFDYMIQGLGGKRIAGILNSENIPTRYKKSLPDKEIKFTDGRPPKATKDILWSDKQVQDIVANPRYKGEQLFLGEVYPSPKIIEPEIWDEAQRAMKARFKSNMKETKYHFILYGLAKCGRCGMNYVGRYKTASRECYYNCSSCRKRSCGNRALSISRFDGLVWSMVRQSGWVRNFILANGSNQNQLRNQITTLEKLIKAEEDKIKKAQTSLERLLSWALEQKSLPEDFVDKKTYEFNSTIQNSEMQIKKLRLEKHSVDQTLASYRNIANIEAMIDQATSDPFQIKKILNSILSRVIITSETTDYQANKYLISLFVKGIENPYSFVYVKDINTIIYQPVYENIQSANNGIETVTIDLNVFSDTTHFDHLFQTIRKLDDNVEVESITSDFIANNQAFVRLGEKGPQSNGYLPRYNDYGVLQGDAREIISRFEIQHGSPIFDPVRIVPDPIPFQPLNVLELDPEEEK